MVETIRVVIADDHPLVRCGVRETLRSADDIALVGEASRGDEAQRLCQELQPDVLLLDLQMPGAMASETIKYVQEACRATRVIILTAYDDEVYVRGMAALGVAGYMLKDEAADTMLGAVRSVMHGGRWFGERVLDMLAAGKPAPPPDADEPVLSELEQRLLQCLMEGMRDKEIAQVLQLPARRVRDELSRNLYAKLVVGSRTEAAVWGWRHGYGETAIESETEGR